MPKLNDNVKKKNIKVHYIYKIYFLCGFPTGRYYLGKHTGKVDDTYAGSGNFCNAYYKKYGKIPGKTYIRCCKGGGKTTGGYKWKYVENE